jgi:hypothetical protein
MLWLYMPLSPSVAIRYVYSLAAPGQSRVTVAVQLRVLKRQGMRNRFAPLLALALAASPATVLADQAQPDDLDQRVRCAAVFSVLARDQITKQPGADAYPSMEGPGKAFFVATGQRLFAERKLDEPTMRILFKAQVGEFQREIAEAKNPKAHFDTAFKACGHYLVEASAVPAN